MVSSNNGSNGCGFGECSMVNWFKKDGFPQKVDNAHQFIEEIKKQNCPSCGKPTLKPFLTEKGKKGWETRVQCETCKVRAIFNDTGFQIGEQIAQEEQKK